MRHGDRAADGVADGHPNGVLIGIADCARPRLRSQLVSPSWRTHYSRSRSDLPALPELTTRLYDNLTGSTQNVALFFLLVMRVTGEPLLPLRMGKGFAPAAPVLRPGARSGDFAVFLAYFRSGWRSHCRSRVAGRHLQFSQRGIGYAHHAASWPLILPSPFFAKESGKNVLTIGGVTSSTVCGSHFGLRSLSMMAALTPS